MLFSHLARIVAVLVLVYAVLMVLIGVSIASGQMGPPDAVLTRYFPSASTTGQLIDKGIYSFVFAIALGALAETSFTLRKVFNKI